jgi:hypothetical protein
MTIVTGLVKVKDKLIYFVLIIAAIAIVLVALPAMGIAIPAVIMQIGWIIFVALIVVGAIILLFDLAGRMK